MAHLPEGWEADYDGTRWFYRFATTGLTQYHFPRPGDEYPELVGLGFEQLDPKLDGKHASKRQHEPPHGVDSAVNENGGMSATGYFNPDDFMYFGLDGASPTGGDKTNSMVSVTATPPVSNSEPALAELHEESEQVRSPVGFIAELANSDTAKCAEELAPIELDAAQIAPAAPPTQKSLVEKKQSIEHPFQDKARPIEEYPLVSASFAYPPIKTTTEPGSPSQLEHEVLASLQPSKDHTGKNEYETWKPTTQVTVNEESRKSNRMSIASPSISVLQSKNGDLGPIEPKRHSLSGPVDPTVPDTLRPLSGPAAVSSIPSQKVESSPIPAVSQPAMAPSKVSRPQDNSQEQPAQNGVPSLPGSGARHESISFDSGVPIVGFDSAQFPAVLKPAHDQQSSPASQSQPQLQTKVDNVRPGAHRVNTMPTQPSSHTSLPPKINGPGFLVFQEIPAATGPHASVVTQPSSGDQAHQLHQCSNQPQSITNEPLSVVAPLNPQKPTSADGVEPNAQIPSMSNGANHAHSGTSQVQVKPEPHRINSPSQQVNTYQSPQAIRPASYQGLMPNSTSPPQKPIRKPVLPQRPESVHFNTGTPVSGSANIPMRPNNSTPQQGVPSTTPTRPTSVIQAKPHSVPPQANPGASSGQHIQAHNQRPSISGSPSHTSQHATAGHSTPVNGHVQGRPSISNTVVLQPSVQGINHGSSLVYPTSNQIVFPGQASTQHITFQAPISNPQNAAQTSTLHNPPGQKPSNSYPTIQGVAQVPSHNPTPGPTTGPIRPQNSPSPITQPVSPLQSQVSSPTPSIASIQRPPSSASSLSTQAAVVGQTPSPAFATHQSNQHVIRPTSTPAAHVQGNQQVNHSPKPPLANPTKPFPMLPGQVTPLPSQVCSVPIPTPTQPATATQGPAQHLQNYAGQMRPSQQHPVNQPPPQTAVHRPPQQQPVQAHHVLNSGGSTPGQSMAAGIQQAQAQPHAHPHSNMSSPGFHNQQGVGQSPNGQSVVGTAQGVMIQGMVQGQTQGQIQMNFSPNTASHQAQPFFTNQQAGLGQGHQQSAHPYGFQTGTSPNFGQGKPSNSAQAAAALSDAGKKMGDAGKKMKKWAKKQWQNPAVKQSTLAVGGAIFSESLGGSGMAGAAIANKIYAAAQNSQPQRPPGLQHANTTPPQALNTAGVGGASQYLQAVAQAQVQGIQQPMGVQTPGRPPIVAAQNPGMAGTAMNNSMMQQRPPMNPNMLNQQSPHQISRPQVGRPPLNQPQQPAAFGQPTYQKPPDQQVFQPAQVQPPYQSYPNQPLYQFSPNQPNYQAQAGPDPYAAIGSMIGGAVNTLAAGGKPKAHAESHQSSHTEQQYTDNTEQQNTDYSEQDQAAYPGPPQADTSYFAPPLESTIINNNTAINNVDNSVNNVDNSNTAVANASQTNTAYTDNSQVSQVMETNNTDNTDNTQMMQMMETNNTSTEGSAYIDTGYTDAANTNASTTMFADATYTDTTSCTDTTNLNTNGDQVAFTDASATYVDSSSYTDASYVDVSYTNDTATADVCAEVNVDVTVTTNETMYADAGDQTSMWMEESASVDASAYVDVSAGDYSGGDWDGGEW
ncbi:hypothetical protein GGR53DRAFT_34381 [Hypoxylon sp. FL1150]|nr:hypothetical protein GGR53DRAFT_34381 [Hypoxylon sp. FL1150]